MMTTRKTIDSAQESVRPSPQNRHGRSIPLGGSWLIAVLILAALSARAEGGAVEGKCFCDEREEIPISQLVRAVNVAVDTIACPLIPAQSGESPAGKCFCGDDGNIAISQLIRAVNVALGQLGCSLGTVVGVSGGVIEVADPRSPIAGTKIFIPAGAVSGGAVTLTPRSDSDAPLPPGSVGLGFGFDLASDELPSSDLEICLPVFSSERRSDHILSGLVFDSEVGRWQAVLPSSVEVGQFNVKSRKLGTWRPGVTLVREVDDDLLFDTVETVHGSDPFSEFQTGVTDLIQPYIDQFTSIDTWTVCSNVTSLINTLLQERAETRKIDLSGVAPQCGACSINSGELLDEVKQLAAAKISNEVTNLTITLLDLDFVAGASLQMVSFLYYQDRISELSCDYQCFLDSNPSEFMANVGKVFAAELAVEVARYVSSNIRCE